MTLVAAYSFDSGAVADVTGRGHDGTLFNAPTFPSGHTNLGLQCLSASNQFVEIADHADFTLGTAWTVMCWVNLYSVSALGTEFVCKQNQWWFSCDNVNFYHGFYKSIGGTKSITSLTSSSTLVGAWNHLAGRYDGSLLSLVLNGVQNNVATPESFTMIDNGNPVRMGTWDGSGAELLNGVLDDVRIYNEWLSDAQITELLNTPVGGYQQSSRDPIRSLSWIS